MATGKQLFLPAQALRQPVDELGGCAINLSRGDTGGLRRSAFRSRNLDRQHQTTILIASAVSGTQERTAGMGPETRLSAATCSSSRRHQACLPVWAAPLAVPATAPHLTELGYDAEAAGRGRGRAHIAAVTRGADYRHLIRGCNRQCLQSGRSPFGTGAAELIAERPPRIFCRRQLARPGQSPAGWVRPYLAADVQQPQG